MILRAISQEQHFFRASSTLTKFQADASAFDYGRGGGIQRVIVCDGESSLHDNNTFGIVSVEAAAARVVSRGVAPNSPKPPYPR